MPIPIKNARDVEHMRDSCRAVAEILEQLKLFVQPGVTTREVDLLAGKLIADRGGISPFLNYKGFPGHICISVNEEVVHGIGGSRRIQFGDIVTLDVGIVLNGWVGDGATTLPVGQVDPAVLRLLDATQEALAAGIAQARPGKRVGNISNAIEKCVHRYGYSIVTDFVGHGVGRKLHEEPHIPNFGRPNDGPELKPGMTLAIEPMVNMGRAEVRILADNWTAVTRDGKPSAHFEHTVLVTEREPEILTCLTTTESKLKEQ
ncbi:MAG: type I methionyl aminopeptidase [Candidatus Methylacidiphilales bacterium]|nr:type I methionyl aminopeptidase [Candidatus Methylacidiphilales bacterium]